MATKTAPKKTTAPEQPKRNLPARQQAAGLPSNVSYGGLAGAGLEGADRESYALPFILVLQKMSPQLDRNHSQFVKGAKEGDFYNTASGEVYDGEEGILVAPVSFKRSFTAWTIREKGGGFRGEHMPSDPIVMTTVQDEKNRNILPDRQTQLVDTRLHAVILITESKAIPALMSLTSTQLKKSKKWVSAMSEKQSTDNLPTLAHAYTIKTIPEKNDKGSWMGLQIDYAAPVADQEHIDAGVAFYKALQSGQAKMAANEKMNGADSDE